MDVFLGEWVNLLLRWFHMIVGIGWIGTSFYFMALDYGLDTKERKSQGVYGTAWQVHGGGFYHVEKFTVAPPQLPAHLHWFKWDAYLTWMTGLRPADRAVLPARRFLPDRSGRDAARAVAGDRDLGRVAARRLGDLRGAVPLAARAEHDTARDPRVRADPHRVGALHQGLFGARRVPACRRVRRHHHGVQRVHGDHPEPAQDGGAAPERRDARRALRRRSASSARPTTTT